MNKRQRKKKLKKDAQLLYKQTGIDILHCEQCGGKLDLKNEYHRAYGTCSSHCYGKLVGVY